MLELAVLDPPRQDWHLDVEVHVQSAGAPTWQRRRASARLTLPAEQPRPG